MNSVRSVPDHEFSDVVLGSAVPVVVGFYAGGRSEVREPVLRVLEDLAAEGDGLGVVGVDIDEAPRTSDAYGISVVPSIVVFSAGTMLLALPGAPSRDTVLHLLRAVLPASSPTPQPS